MGVLGVLGGCYAVLEGIFNLSSWHVRRLGKADDAFDKRIPKLEMSVEILVTDVGVMKGTLSSIEATLSSMLNIQQESVATLSSMLNIQTGILIAILATIIFVIVIGGLLIFAAAAFFWWNKREAPQAQNAQHGGGGGGGGGGGADIGGWTQSQLVQAINAPNEAFAAGAHTPLASPLPTAAAAATPAGGHAAAVTPKATPAAEHAAAAAPAPAPAPAPA